jgi:lipid A 4'-phosphatase
MKPLVLFIALAALTLVVFAIWPGFDLAISHRFYDSGGFIGHERLARLGRDFFRVTPFVVLALYAALWLAKRKGARLGWAPSGRAVVFLIATMAVGPGLIVNLGLKDHWHRPRPYQTQEFGGPDPFRPWYKDNGLCKKNCSFVSGEAATGFWMAAPASVLPPPWRAPAMAAAFAFAIGASLLRMAFGGHYLSDVLLGGLVTLIVIELSRRAIWPHGAEERAQDRALGVGRSRNAPETGSKGVSPATPNGGNGRDSGHTGGRQKACRQVHHQPVRGPPG